MSVMYCTPEEAKKYLGAVINSGPSSGCIVEGLIVAKGIDGHTKGETWLHLGGGRQDHSHYIPERWHKIGNMKNIRERRLSIDIKMYLLGCPLREKYLKERL